MHRFSSHSNSGRTQMRAYIIAANIFNFLVLLSLLFAFSYVFLNYTFTHSDLPDDNIPFFIHDDPGNPTEKWSGRFQLYWWILATNTLRIIVPFLLLTNIVFMKFLGPGLSIFIRVIFAIIFIWEWIKFIWLILLWIPVNCGKHQFCRNFGARRELMVEIGDNPELQNAVFTFEVFYTLAFALVMGVYIVLVGNLRQISTITKKAPASNNVRPTRLWGNVILGIILTLGLIFYFAIVFLNFTFTNAKTTNTLVPPDLLFNLPDGNVPYYINDVPDDPTELNSGRSELYWWFLATDTLLILIPSIYLTDMVLKVFKYKNYPVVAQGFLVIVLIWQIIKTIWITALSLSKKCAGHQFCRALGARRDMGGNEIGDDPGIWNKTYATYVWFSIGFVVILAIYFFINLQTNRFGLRKKKKSSKRVHPAKSNTLRLPPESKKKKERSKNR